MTAHVANLDERIAGLKSPESNEIFVRNMTNLLSEFVLAILLETIFDSQEGEIDRKFQSYIGMKNEII